MSDEPEEWRAVVGWEGLYEVSSLGRVRSLDRHRTYSNGRGALAGLHKFQGKILVGSFGTGGRCIVLLADRINGRTPKTLPVHRIVLCAFHGPPFPQAEGAHRDGNFLNNRASNLMWATKIENEGHKLGHGTLVHGEKHKLHKLTANDVAEIRKMKGSETSRGLAARYGVSQSLISHIWRGKAWLHD